MRRWEARAEPVAGERMPRPVLIVVRGDIDGANCADWGHRLRELAASSGSDVLIDLSGLTLLTASGGRVLAHLAEQWGAAGRRTRIVVGANPVVARVVEIAEARVVLTVHESVAAALSAPDRPASLPDSWFVIREAVRQLQEQYGLSDAGPAVSLLQSVAREHRIRVHRLAAAAAGPAFPGQPAAGEAAEPILPFPVGAVAAPKFVTVLDHALRAALRATETPAGYAQLVAGGFLRMASAHGIGRDLRRYLGQPGHESTPCARAARGGTRVTVGDVREDVPLAGTPALDMLRAEGILFACSTPVVDGEGRSCRAVLSLVDGRAGRGLTYAQADELDRIAEAVSRWAQWDDDRRVRTAVSDLHAALAAGTPS
ncbi:STAS domain-containing protein [Amycolatopsis jiangsuensis]|uniref:Anti-anti-sigma factor n=1 Tax=Amycolatopsis jiangsuensis TaxID=1181879 RepID=A0A840J6A7_9PSEU|nr:STAS domain-containing protein [Amycolatopsis jiangsuensis]MBB4689135.1 anti-anti-sigma factor [Amycolatopsis jiangsuensis]